jgi:predicted nucleotidyltransferase component of viral defense system
MMDALRDHLVALPAHQRLNGAREYLQRLLLQVIDQEEFRKGLAFTGGTALHIVYGTRRFSEDLDFSLVQPDGYDTSALSRAMNKRLYQQGLKPEIGNLKEEKTVASFFIRFVDLLYPLKLSPNKDQKLTIKVEVDKRPPAGGEIEETLIQEPLFFLTNHFTLPSLFATKIHAILFRRYTKGRDYYDLLFYLGKKIRPNLKLFQNAAAQTHPDLEFPTLTSVRDALRRKIEALDEKRVIADVEPFLSDPVEARYLRKDILLKTLDQNASLFLVNSSPR